MIDAKSQEIIVNSFISRQNRCNWEHLVATYICSIKKELRMRENNT